jgi:hypothetical protein
MISSRPTKVECASCLIRVLRRFCTANCVVGRNLTDGVSNARAAVDAIERAVQHGNIAGARGILAQLIAGNTLQETDVAALTKLIDEAEAENPIAELGKCRAPGAFTFVKDKGGKIISQPAGGGAGEEIALMMADFDHDQQHADGRGRGIAALKEVKEGEILLEVPPAAHMSVKSAESTPGIDKVFKAESAANGGVLRSFNGLALFLLHQTHKVDSAFREYICSLPLHIPLPFLWNDADLPEEFLADDKVVQDRLNARELVELSYNITVPAMLEKYPDVFQAEELTTSKWSWACSVIMSRALPFKKSGGMLGSSFSLGDNLVDFDPVTLLEGFKTASQPDSALHTLIPVVDMINHESSEKLGCGLSVKSDGTVLITAGPSGLSRGYEVAVSYSDKLCGTKPLNRFGFVLPPCPGDEGADPSTSSSE